MQLKVAVVVDQAKHGYWLSQNQVLYPDLLVDSHDPERAVSILRSTLGKQARFAIDTRGRESATLLLQAITTHPSTLVQKTKSPSLSPPSTPPNGTSSHGQRSHLIGLTGLPKEPTDAVLHTVPIKLFHEVPEVGGALTKWLSSLLERGKIVPPRIIDVEYGFENVNSALDRMRRGEISGGKLVVRI